MSQTMNPGAGVRHELRRPSAPAFRPAAEDIEPRLDALSAAVAGLVGDYGRTPASAVSWRLGRRRVVTALTDFMTAGERELVHTGHAGLVRELRSAFVQVIDHEYLRAAEAALGCEVIAHRTDLICASNVCVETFLLGSERHTAADGAGG